MKRTSKKTPVLLAYLLLVIATVVAYAPIRHNDFTSYDDDDYITNNPNVQLGLTRQSVIWAFTTSHEANWHPITWLSHMLDCQLFGLEPLGHHLTNLFFHIANTLLVLWVFKKMTGALWPSAFVAAAFALHPLHVESVAWASERKDVLSTFFWMLTMAAYVRYTQQRTIIKYLPIVLFFALGLMAKPMLVTLPFVLLLLDYWPLARWPQPQPPNSSKRKPSKKTRAPQHVIYRLLWEKVPLFVLSAASCVVTFFVQRGGGAVVKIDLMPFDIRITNALASYVTYLGKMIYPASLAPLYPLKYLLAWQPIISFFILVVISVVVIYWARRRPYLIVGWLWYMGTLVPVIGLLQVGVQAYADRYTYLPLLGIFIMIAWFAAELTAKWRRLKLAIGISTVLMITAALMICTQNQVRKWRDNCTLYKHTLAVTENNGIMHYNYGCALLNEKEDFETAIEHFKKTLQIRPTKASALNNWGVALQRLGKEQEAIEKWNQSIQISPDNPNTNYHLGMALQRQQKYEDAAGHFEKSLQVKPVWYVHSSLGDTYFQMGKIDLAIDQWTRAINLNPFASPVHNKLAWLLTFATDPKLRDTARAVKFAQQACELTRYEQYPFLETLAAAYAADGQLPLAVQTVQKALDLAIATGNKDAAAKIQKQLENYKEKQLESDKAR